MKLKIIPKATFTTTDRKRDYDRSPGINIMRPSALFLLVAFAVMISCSGNEDRCGLPDLSSRDNCDGPMDQMGMGPIELMNLYVLEEELNVTRRSDNLFFIIKDPGEAGRPGMNSSVTVNYRGYYRNNCKFDGADDVTFSLFNLIEGWKRGIPLIGKCGSIQLIVPPELAYGSNPTNGILKGEPLIFDIQLLDF